MNCKTCHKPTCGNDPCEFEPEAKDARPDLCHGHTMTNLPSEQDRGDEIEELNRILWRNIYPSFGELTDEEAKRYDALKMRPMRIELQGELKEFLNKALATARSEGYDHGYRNGHIDHQLVNEAVGEKMATLDKLKASSYAWTFEGKGIRERLIQEGYAKGREEAKTPPASCPCVTKARSEGYAKGKADGAEEERSKWTTLLAEHKKVCSTAGQKHLTVVKNTIIGKHLIRWKLLFEKLSEAVLDELPFPGETSDGRCPKCDDGTPCAYCIAAVSPMEAQEAILQNESLTL